MRKRTIPACRRKLAAATARPCGARSAHGGDLRDARIALARLRDSKDPVISGRDLRKGLGLTLRTFTASDAGRDPVVCEDADGLLRKLGL